MTDHIKRSLEIQAFLDKEKIKVEPDEFAPKVWRYLLYKIATEETK